MKKVKKENVIKKATCNQCGQQMGAQIELENWAIPVCVNPECANFSLLQISMEKVNKFMKKNEK